MSESLSEPRRLHPATLIVRWLKIVPQMLFAGVGIAAATRGGGIDRFLWFALIMAGVGGLFALLFWWRFTYRVGDGEVVIEKGLFQRQRRVIPFDRVQDIAIEQRLLARLFGTAKVRIETGGAAKDEGDLDMISLADAQALRDRIRRGPGAVAIAEAEEAREEPVLFAMSIERLLLSGLFGFSLVFFAAIAAFVQQLDQFGLVEWDNLVTEERAEAAAGYATVQLALILALLILAAGVVAGVARTVARDYGFRLTRAESGLRRRRGLFTLSEVVIPLRRTQVALIETGILMRRLGWHRLSFQTLGADQKERGLQVAAPFARMAEIAPILAEAGFPMPPPRSEFRGVPRRALLRQAAPWLVLAGLATIAAFAFDLRAGIGAAALLVAAVLAVLRYRKHGHALGEAALFVSSGLLTRRLWIVPYEKAQTINLSRGPVQRRMRLASLLVDTAGASPLRAPEMADLDFREAERMAEELLARFYRARAAFKYSTT
ncbi:MAG TPA: PH domain-containing protein [Allosphingosinicella sp.]|nr:PH domain-containing protein [Allosphingosinicella sp.]